MLTTTAALVVGIDSRGVLRLSYGAFTSQLLLISWDLASHLLFLLLKVVDVGHFRYLCPTVHSL